MITLSRLKECLMYVPNTGNFIWNISVGNNRIKRGSKAGTLLLDGYIAIRIDKEVYKGHRLAWFYSTGEWPLEELDHINRIRNDNRIQNLRLASRLSNSHNMKKFSSNTSGYTGVHKSGSRWKAIININKRSSHLGTFDSKEEAYYQYVFAAKSTRHEFWRDNSDT